MFESAKTFVRQVRASQQNHTEEDLRRSILRSNKAHVIVIGPTFLPHEDMQHTLCYKCTTPYVAFVTHPMLQMYHKACYKQPCEYKQCDIHSQKKN